MKVAYFIGALAALFLATALAPATPLACSSCDITASSAGYTGTVVEVTSGGIVTWTSTDIAHLQLDSGTHDACLAIVANGGEPSGPTWLNLTVDGLMVTGDREMGNGLERSTLSCGNAVTIPDGSALLAYQCAFHPTMRGALLVTKG